MPSLTKKEKSALKETIEKDINTLKEQIAILEEKVKPIAPDLFIGETHAPGSHG